jgi:hypothetical protein
MQGQPWRGTEAGFFVLAKFRQDVNFFKKTHNPSVFGWFQLLSVREKYSKNTISLLLLLFNV